MGRRIFLCVVVFLTVVISSNSHAGWLDDLKKVKKTIKEVEEIKEITEPMKTEATKAKASKTIQKSASTDAIPANKSIVFDDEKVKQVSDISANGNKKKSKNNKNPSKFDKKPGPNDKEHHSTSDKEVLFVVAPGHNGSNEQQLGQARLLDARKRPILDSSKGLLTPQKKYALTYIKYYPESLEKDSMVQSLAQMFFPKKVRKFLNSAPSVFEKRRKMKEWRKKIKNIKEAPAKTVQYYFPTQFSGQYDFNKQSFPIGVRIPFNVVISSGVAGLTCIELNQNFKLSELKVAEDEAEDFLKRNKSHARTSSVYIGLRFTITGKAKKKAGMPPKCQLAAHVDRIEAFEYREKKNSQQGYLTAKISKRIKDWTVADLTNADIEMDNQHKKMTGNIPQEAKDFKLVTKQGYILALSNESHQIYGLSQNERDAFYEYASFLELGINPNALKQAPKCYAKTYLEQTELTKYMDKKGLNWIGTTSFEKDRNKATFLEIEGVKLLKRAVKIPQKLIVVSKFSLPQYNKKWGGYFLNGLSNRAAAISFNPFCYQGNIQALSPADQASNFWEISPESAEKMLNNLPDKTSRGNLVYVASIVSLNTINTAQREKNKKYNQNPPVTVSIESTQVYADKELSQKLHSVKLIKSNPSILQTGVPKKLKVKGEYVLSIKDYSLLTLKHQGDILDDNNWQELSAFQGQSDRDYYSHLYNLSRIEEKPSNMPMAANSFSQSYRPFYPQNTEISMAKMSPQQKNTFKKWMRLRAKHFPKKISYSAPFRWHEPTGQTNLELGTSGKRITLPPVIARLGIKQNQIFYPMGDRYGNAPVVYTKQGNYTVIYAFPKALNHYAKLSPKKLKKWVKKMGHPSSSISAQVELKIKSVKYLKGKTNNYMLIQAKPLKYSIANYGKWKL